MSDRRTVLIVGGPAAGKSNYIFRLWLALRDGTQRKLGQGRLPDEAEYLAEGANAQLGGAFAGHTPHGTGAVCEIPIVTSGFDASLVLPDRPGEEWLRLYSERRWPSEWEHLITPQTTCLVFLRANSVFNVSPPDWMVVQEAYGRNEANLDGSAPTVESGTPTQVVLVEWIQMLLHLFRRYATSPLRPRIGIVISAWDVLSDEDRSVGPLGLLKREFRLLGDFVESNSDRFDLGLFGVSLYGGDFDQQAGFRAEFLAKGDYQSRGYVVQDDLKGNVQQSPDLTLPVEWALGLTER